MLPAEIVERVYWDYGQLYRAKIQSLIQNCQEKVWVSGREGWTILNLDGKNPDSHCMVSLSMKFVDSQEPVYLKYDRGLEEKLVNAFLSQCNAVNGILFTKTTLGDIPPGGKYIKDELFRIVNEVKLEKAASFNQSGEGGEMADVVMRLAMQCFALSRYLRPGQHPNPMEL